MNCNDCRHKISEKNGVRVKSGTFGEITLCTSCLKLHREPVFICLTLTPGV